MITVFLHALFLLLPLLVIVSGMAMTPALLVLAVLILFAKSNKIFESHPHPLREAQLPSPACGRGVGRGCFTPKYKNLLIILALVLTWPLLSSAWSITPGRSLSSAVGAITLCGAAGAAFLRLPILTSPPEKIIRYYALSIAAASVLMLLETLPHGGLIGLIIKALGMDYGRYIDKNVNRGLCALTLLVWPAVLGLCSLGMRRAGWGLLLLLMLPLFLMESLSAQMGLVCGTLVFALVQWFPLVMPRLIAVATVAFLLGFPLMFHTLDAPFSSQPEMHNHLPETAQQRLVIWRFVLERVAEKPWLGWGMDTARAIPGGTDILTIHGKSMAQLPLHPHNTPLHVLLEEGIIGLVLTLGAVALVFWRWLKMPTENKAQFASAGALIISFLATGISSFGIWQTWWIASLWAAALVWRSFAEKPLTSPPSSL